MLPRGVCGNCMFSKSRLEGDFSLASFRTIRVGAFSGATPVFDVAPHAVAPAYAGPNLLTELARHGLYQAAFHQLLYGAPAAAAPDPPAHLAIREASAGRGRTASATSCERGCGSWAARPGGPSPIRVSAVRPAGARHALADIEATAQ